MVSLFSLARWHYQRCARLRKREGARRSQNFALGLLNISKAGLSSPSFAIGFTNREIPRQSDLRKHLCLHERCPVCTTGPQVGSGAPHLPQDQTFAHRALTGVVPHVWVWEHTCEVMLAFTRVIRTLPPLRKIWRRQRRTGTRRARAIEPVKNAPSSISGMSMQ